MEMIACLVCDGVGQITVGTDLVFSEEVCPLCDGSGAIPESHLRQGLPELLASFGPPKYSVHRN